ncbi:MAG TPA: hypothetical protein ACFYD2_04540 [Candidatus Avalokitesvara rifleensis]|uniref:hypothetical protein n=1 Tax=Candidatus Avalokitesvara rifleensis TaxID=3367620 RepID=UPI002713167B|nr:hypothetical protein [Candidatus Brocadiales bacterium]
MSSLKWVLIGLLVIIVIAVAVVFVRGFMGSPKRVVTIEKFYGGIEEGGDLGGLELEDSKSDRYGRRIHTYFIDRLEDGERYKEYPRITAYGDGKIQVIGPEEEGSWEFNGSVKGKMYFKSHEQTNQEVTSPLTYKDWVIKWWEGDNYKVIVISDTSRDAHETFKISLE